MNKALKWTCGLLSAGILFLLLVYLLRGPLISPYLLRLIAETVKTQTGVELEIDKIAGTYFTGFSISGVKTVRPNPAGPLVSLDLTSLKARYSLLSLFYGFDNFMGDSKIDADGARIVLQLDEDQAPPPDDAGPNLSWVPGRLPSVRLANASVMVMSGEAMTRFSGISIATRPRDGSASQFNLAVTDWSWHHPALHDHQINLSAAGTLTGETLTIERLSLKDGLIVGSVIADLRPAPEALPFRAKVRISDGTINLAGKWSADGLQLQTDAERLNLDGLPVIVKLPYAELGGFVDWKGEAEINTATPFVSRGRLKLSIANGLIDGMSIEHIDLTTGLKDELLTIEDLTARADGNSLKLENLHGPAPLLFSGDFRELASRINGGFSFQAENLPALFKVFGARSDTATPAPPHALNLQGQFDRGRLSVGRGQLAVSDSQVSLSRLEVQIPDSERPWSQSVINAEGKVSITALKPIAALFDLPALEGSLEASIHVSGTIGTPEGRAAIEGRNMAWQDARAETVTLEVTGDRERITVAEFKIKQGRDRFSGHGGYNLSTGKLEDSRLELDLADIYPYITMLSPAANWLDRQRARVSGHLKGRISLNGLPARPDGAADIKITKLTVQDRHFGDAILQVSKQGEHISSEKVSLHNGDDFVLVEGGINLSAGSAEALSLSARIADIGHYTRGLVAPLWDSSGSIRIEAQASGPLVQPDARVQADFKQFKVGRIEISAAALRGRSTGRLFHLDSFDLERPHQRLKLSGTVQNDWSDAGLVLDAKTCEIQMHDLELALSQPTRVAYSRAGALSFDSLVLQGPTGRVDVNGILAMKSASDLRVGIENFKGTSWLAALTGDRSRFEDLDADLYLTGLPEKLNIKATGGVSGIVIQNYPDPLNGNFDLDFTRTGIEVRRMEIHGPTGPDLSLTGKFPVQVLPELVLLPGSIEAAGSFSVPDLKLFNAFMSAVRIKRGELQADFRFGGSWQQLDGHLKFGGRNVDVDTDWQPLPPGPYTFEGDLDIKRDRLTVQSLALNSPSLTATAGGSWTGMASPLALLAPSATGLVGTLEGEGKLVIPDMGWLARGMSSLRRTGGRLEADLHVTGPVAKPNIETGVRITDGELQTDIGIPPLRAIQLTARLNQGGLQLERLEALVGGSPVLATGTMRWDTADPQAVDLSLKGTNLLLYRDESILMRADTDLKLQGPLERMLLSGDTAITKGLVKKNLNIFGALRGGGGPKAGPELQLFSFSEPPFSKMRFDVRLASKSPVDIRGNIAHGSVRPELHLGGTGLLPVLTGRIYADSTRVNLPAGRLTIHSGVIRFLETDPELPVLDLYGGSRMLGYDISVQIEGPYNEPEITLSSVPPLPGDDLMLLLVTGQPPKGTLGKSGRQRQNIQVAVYVARDMFGDLFSNGSSEEVDEIIDRFDFQLGRNVTRSGDETIEAQFRVIDGLILKNDRLFITGEKDDYDYINTGVKLVFRFK